ncbi:MAG: hypothetical protein LBH13_04110 [Cellulomonadaceae bacterium]|nr:hypothetical protein [Cellulomonadaceae bacterium]
MTAQESRTPSGPADDQAILLDIATVIDRLCEAREMVDPFTVATESLLRRELFALLDNPTQITWERVREVEIAPHFVTGLTTPSPLGVTVGDAAYAFGVSDVTCPDRRTLMGALNWLVGELQAALPA